MSYSLICDIYNDRYVYSIIRTDPLPPLPPTMELLTRATAVMFASLLFCKNSGDKSQARC